MSNPADSPLPMVIPAKAGIYWAAAQLAEMWVPAGVILGPAVGRTRGPGRQSGLTLTTGLSR